MIPGTGVIYTISIGISLSWRSSIFAAVGCTMGIVPHMAATVLGLSAILHMSAQLFQIIKLIGAVYLLYLAWLMWNETRTLEFDREMKSTRYSKITLKGFLINILNPKLTVFFFAFLPLFISPAASSPTREMLFLGIVFMAMTFIVFVAYGILASNISQFFTQSPNRLKRLQRSFSIIFVILAAELVLTDS
ncbi:MAG: LysE family translocator [Anaerolineae bacterium]